MTLNPMPAEIEQRHADERAPKSYAQEGKKKRKFTGHLGAHEKKYEHRAKDRLNVLKLRKQVEEGNVHSRPYLSGKLSLAYSRHGHNNLLRQYARDC